MKNPKSFTTADIVNGRIYIEGDFELVFAPLPWQERGLVQTRSGYGSKLTTQRKINFNGKLYRIYATCYSNVASNWFTVKGQKIFVA